MNGHTLYMPVPQHLFQKASPVPSSARVTHLMGTRLSFSQALGGPAAGAPVRSYLAWQSRPLLSSPFQSEDQGVWVAQASCPTVEAQEDMVGALLVGHHPSLLCAALSKSLSCPKPPGKRMLPGVLYGLTSQLGKAAAASVFLALA